MLRRPGFGPVTLLMLAVALGTLTCTPGSTPGRRGAPPAPVEVAPVERGPITLRRTHSGTLEAPARFVVAPNVGGRVERLAVDLGDPVRRGQVVAELQDDEFRQLAAQAKADLAVARANLTQAENGLEVASRELKRIETLRQRGISSEAQLDAAQATQLERRAAVAVATAQVARASAALDAARIRLGYARVTASWTGGSDERRVARRYVSEGALVAENDPLIEIVELDPILAVIFVTEREYALLAVEQEASLTVDAYPDETFVAKVHRIAPVFEPGSRQARVELRVENEDRRLKPGMFVRATVDLKTIEDAMVVPYAAITTRDDQTGVFEVSPDGSTAAWRPVEVGIRAEDRVQLLAPSLSGRVVTLGQQLLDDGSKIAIPPSEAAVE